MKIYRIAPCIVGIVGVVLLIIPAASLAHSSVTPSETYVSKNETYSVSVPTEKDVPTIGIRLIIPDGLDRVSPLVKAGWRVNIKKDASGKVTELEWLGGSIPAGQKDIFEFSGRAPATSTVLAWKAYQTYRDGEIVAWDADPKSIKPGDTVLKPYSTTHIVATSSPVVTHNKTDRLPLALSVVALLLSLTSLSIVTTRKV